MRTAEELLLDGLKLFPLDVREDIPAKTESRGGSSRSCKHESRDNWSGRPMLSLRLGASRVAIAEGPGASTRDRIGGTCCKG